MIKVSRRELITALSLASVGCSGNPPATKETAPDPVAAASPYAPIPISHYRNAWLTSQPKIKASTAVAMKFYGLIAAITTKGSPRGALFVKGHAGSNSHHARLYVRVAEVTAGQNKLQEVRDGVGHWNLDGLSVRVVKKGEHPTSAPATFGPARHIWGDPKLLLKLNDLVNGLVPKTAAEMISSTCANAYVEFVGGTVEPSVPFTSAGRAGLFEIVGTGREPVSMTDNFISFADYGPRSEVDILVRPIDSPGDPEQVLGTVRPSSDILTLFFSNDLTVPVSQSGDVISHSAAYWKLFKPQSVSAIGGDTGLPKFFAGIGGESLRTLYPAVGNMGDPICNGGQIEEGV